MGNKPGSKNQSIFARQDNLQSPKQIGTEVNVATSLDRNTILLEVNGKKIQTLVDSGASVSCIQKEMFDKINRDNCFEIRPSKIARIFGVGGERHHVLGQTKIALKITGLTVEQSFIIVEQLHHPLILGLDFMHEHNVNIDFYRRVMTIHDNLVAVALTCDNSLAMLEVSRR